MAEDYAAPVVELVRKTPNTREGMTKIARAAGQAIEKIDENLAELLSQRDELHSILRHFVRLYEILLGADIRSEGVAIPGVSGEISNLEDARRAVIRAAERSKFDEVTDEWVMQQTAQLGALPWRNPKAVIATILTRSGKWKRKGKGVFVRVKDEEAAERAEQ